MANFNTAYQITKGHEGGWHGGSGANRADRGGETFKGIARRFWANWEGWKIVDDYKTKIGFPNNALRDNQLNLLVMDVYKKEFWDINRLGEIRNQPVANELFDSGVNVGVMRSAIWLQRAMNLLNRNQRNWRDLTVDGKIGNITLGAVNRLNDTDTKSLFNLLNVYQGKHYIILAEKDPTQQDFIRGWLTRVELMR